MKINSSNLKRYPSSKVSVPAEKANKITKSKICLSGVLVDKFFRPRIQSVTIKKQYYAFEFSFNFIGDSERWLDEICLNSVRLNDQSRISYFFRENKVQKGVIIFIKNKTNCRPLDLTDFSKSVYVRFCGHIILNLNTVLIVIYMSTLPFSQIV